MTYHCKTFLTLDMIIMFMFGGWGMKGEEGEGRGGGDEEGEREV